MLFLPFKSWCFTFDIPIISFFFIMHCWLNSQNICPKEGVLSFLYSPTLLRLIVSGRAKRWERPFGEVTYSYHRSEYMEDQYKLERLLPIIIFGLISFYLCSASPIFPSFFSLYLLIQNKYWSVSLATSSTPIKVVAAVRSFFSELFNSTSCHSTFPYTVFPNYRSGKILLFLYNFGTTCLPTLYIPTIIPCGFCIIPTQRQPKYIFRNITESNVTERCSQIS